MAFLGTTIATATMRYRAERKRTLIKAAMCGEFLPVQEALVRNVSAHGLGMTTQGLLPDVGEQLCIRLSARIEVTGRVVWVDGRSFGIALDAPLDVSRLDTATHRQNEGLVQAVAWHIDRQLQPPAEPVSRLRTCFV